MVVERGFLTRMDYAEFISNVGFPVAITLSVLWAGYRQLQTILLQASERESAHNLQVEKFTKIMQESALREMEYNKHVENFSVALTGFNETLVLMNKDLAEVKSDVGDIKKDLERERKYGQV